MTDQLRLAKLCREVHAVLTENRTSCLRVSIPNGIATNTYELRLVKVVAKFKIQRPTPAKKSAAPDGRKKSKGNK